MKLYKQFISEIAAVASVDILNLTPEDTHNDGFTALLAKYENIKKDDPGLLNLGQQCYNNIALYGAPTWYEWSIQNWGTKWNAYQQSRVDENTIEFLTAWSGVPKIMESLSEQYPDLLLSYMYADEDWGRNAGEYEYEAGECLYEHRPPGGSEEARRITEELLGPRFEDEDENESEDDEDWEDEL